MARQVTAVRLCCATGHPHNQHRAEMQDSWIIPNVMASIMYCDERRNWRNVGGARFAAAADRLRDFATVELLCAELGITRKELS